jgi:Mu transposase, C-terminal
LRYSHEALAPLIGSKERLCVRYDPRDVRSVLVRGTDGLLLEVPTVSPDVPAISLAEHRAQRRQAREEGRDPGIVAMRDKGARRTATGIRDASDATRSARRRRKAAEQRRVDGVEGGAPPVEPSLIVEQELSTTPASTVPFVAVAQVWNADGMEDSP